jgi:hypothetical protein
MIEFFVRLSICLIITGLYFFFCFQYWKKNKDATELNSLMKFPPFPFSIFTFFWLLLLYLAIEINPLLLSPRAAFKALDQHGFISFLFKCFIASSAIIIAWHRSLTSDKQIKLQVSSNNISNYYSIQEHIKDDITNNATSINLKYLELGNSQNLFNFLFTNPSEGNYNPSPKLHAYINKANKLEDDLLKEINLLSTHIKDNSSTIFLSHFVGYGRITHFINHCLDIDQTTTLMHARKIHSIRKSINETLTLIIDSCGLNPTKLLSESRIKDEFRNLDIKLDILDYLNNLVSHCPIHKECIINFQSLLTKAHTAKIMTSIIDRIESHEMHFV